MAVPGVVFNDKTYVLSNAESVPVHQPGADVVVLTRDLAAGILAKCERYVAADKRGDKAKYYRAFGKAMFDLLEEGG